MKVISFLFFIIIIFTISCNKSSPNPTIVKSFSITSLSPDSGSYGTLVTIIGKNLPAPDSIKLNGRLCSIKDANGDTISITVPKAAGSGPVILFFKDSTITLPDFHFHFTNYVTTVAGSQNPGSINGTGMHASFNSPFGVATDSIGNIYVSEFGYIRKIDSNAVVSFIAGNGAIGYQDGPANTAEFRGELLQLTRDPQGNLYVYDRDNLRIRKIAVDGMVGPYVGNGSLGQTNGPATGSSIGLDVRGLLFNNKGDFFFTDQTYIRKVTPDGIVSNYVGNGTNPAGLTVPAPETDTSGPVFAPNALCTDGKGNIYFGDAGFIREITPDGVVKTLAGSLYEGVVDGPAATAEFTVIMGIAIDTVGNIYVSELSDRIRKLGTDGMVSTFAGSGGGFADGPADQALFNYPFGIAFDRQGNLIVADQNNNRIRKIVIQ